MFDIDIIMPFHRYDKYLIDSINSIEKIEKIYFRLIAVDDRKDKSYSLPRFSFPSKIVTTGGLGYSAALRAGLELVTSPFTAFLDSDDLTHSQRIYLQLKHLKENDLNVSICGMNRIDASSRRMIHPLLFKDSTSFRASQLIGSINSNSTWVFESKLITLPDFFPKNFDSIDWATSLLIDDSIRIGILPQRLYSYRHHPEQMTRTFLYSSTFFHQIYNLWALRNEEMQLPYLSLQAAASVAAPSRISKKEVDFPWDWVEHFLELPNVKNSQDYRAFISTLARRISQNGFETKSLLPNFVKLLLKSLKVKFKPKLLR